jgi:hypothetical protein
MAIPSKLMTGITTYKHQGSLKASIVERIDMLESKIFLSFT